MKILFIIPSAPQDHSGRINSRKHVKRGFLPPLGVGYIAAVLLQAGHQAKIIDAQVLELTVDEILREVDAYRPDVLGISFLTPQEDSAYGLIRRLKQRFKDIPVIVGGAHPTCFPRETMEKCSGIDVLVAGEGEHAVLGIMSCLESRRTWPEVKGIYYRNERGQILETPPDDRPIDLEALPFPARHLYPMEAYIPEPFENKKLPSTNIIVSRGCAYAQCTFCYRSGILKREPRIQSVAKTLEEIKGLVREFGMKEFIFYDDDLAAHQGWLTNFCDALDREKLNLSWSFRARVNHIDEPILKRAKETGCVSVSFGFESGNQDLLNNIKKGITLEQSRRAAALANGLGLEVIGAFMLALPGETPEKAEETIRFAIELDCTYAAFIPTHPFRGTPLYEQCLREGKVIVPAYSEKMCETRYLPSVTYVPAGYKNAGEVEAMIRKAYRKFYLRPGYFLKHLKKIRTSEDVKRYWDGLRFLSGLS
ncbi:MAG: radical SAM protein [Candidatus Omnitrophota bacterium]